MADDEDDDDRPRKKKTRRPIEDDEDDRPRRKKKRARDDDDDTDLGSTALSALIPVGGSVFALVSLWLSVIAVLLTVAAAVFFLDPRSIWSCVLPALWPVSLLSGGLSFFTHKHKTSYGSITGNIRAIIGILISLGVMAAHGFLVFVFLTRR